VQKSGTWFCLSTSRFVSTILCWGHQQHLLF
jgi:hypothetical protein